MTFEEAVNAVRAGDNVRRPCWDKGNFIAFADIVSKDWIVTGDEHGADTPTPQENRAEAIGKTLGTVLALLALLGARPGDKPPEVHVNIITIH